MAAGHPLGVPGVDPGRPRLGSTRSWLEATGWALSLIGFISFGHYVWETILLDGGFAYDLNSYILAGRNVLEGRPLYEPVQINDPGAYRYPPTFAILAAPLAIPPEEVVTWLYRALCVACVRYLVGSWRAVGWALLIVALQIELISLNVTLPIAAAVRMALRGPGTAVGAALIPATAALKYGTALLLPYVWLTRPELRRPILLGLGALLAAFALHALVDIETWRAYIESLGQQSGSVNDAPFVGDQLIFLVPSTLGDFLLRFAIGAVLVAIAIRYRWDWLAFSAAVLAVPTLWLARLGALVGAPLLWWEARNESARTLGPADSRKENS